jgi:Uracil phosphoribosyltransferase
MRARSQHAVNSHRGIETISCVSATAAAATAHICAQINGALAPVAHTASSLSLSIKQRSAAAAAPDRAHAQRRPGRSQRADLREAARRLLDAFAALCEAYFPRLHLRRILGRACRGGDQAERDDLIYEKLPHDIAQRHVLLLDPVLGTGNTASRAVRVLLEKDVLQERIMLLTLIASRKGIEVMMGRTPGIKVITTEIDHSIDHNYRVVPGVGEFGDRYFCE